jgi:hypothetical protein
MLSNDIDNALSEGERQMVAGHLKICSECREFYGKIKTLDTVLDRLESMAVPEYFSRRVIQELRKKKPINIIKWSEFWKFKNAPAYAGVVGIILLSLLFGNYIGKSLYKEIFGDRLRSYYKNSNICGIEESRVQTDSMCYVVYDKIKREVHND